MLKPGYRTQLKTKESGTSESNFTSSALQNIVEGWADNTEMASTFWSRFTHFILLLMGKKKYSPKKKSGRNCISMTKTVGLERDKMFRTCIWALHEILTWKSKNSSTQELRHEKPAEFGANCWVWTNKKKLLHIVVVCEVVGQLEMFNIFQYLNTAWCKLHQ